MAASTATDLLKLIMARTRDDQQANGGPADAANPLSVLDPGELQLSRLLGWLLDPQGSHGEGQMLLAAFVERFFPDLSAERPFASARVTLEAPVTWLPGSVGRRMDILVEGSEWMFAIENKPFAGWQELQLSCYRDELAARKPSAWRLIAIVGGTGDAQAEVEAHWPGAKEDRRVVAASYSELAAWATVCATRTVRDANAVYLRAFAEHFDTVERRGISRMTDTIVRELAGDPQAYGTALEIEAAMTGARAQMTRQLMNIIETRAKASWILDYSWDYNTKQKMAGPCLWDETRKLGVYFFIYGPFDFVPWVGIPSDESGGLLKASLSDSATASGKWFWWRHMTVEDFGLAVGADVSKAWMLPAETLADTVLTIANELRSRPSRRNRAPV